MVWIFRKNGKREYRVNGKGRGRPLRRWRDKVKELLMRKGLSEREEIGNCFGRK